jgi:hypothetical protein
VSDRFTQPGDGRIWGPPARRSPRPVSPELVGAILAAMVVAIIGGGMMGGGASPVAPLASGQASPSPFGTAEPTAAVDESLVAALLEFNDRLRLDRVALDRAAAAAHFQPSDVATILRELNADVVSAMPVAARLERLPPSAAVGTLLAKFYDALHTHVSDALGNSLQNAPAYRTAAKSTSLILTELPTLNAKLEALLIGRPAPSGSLPAPSRVPSPPPSAGPTRTPPPRSASPSAQASPSVANGLVNPGFESGVGAPWALFVSGTGAATWTADQVEHAGGTTAARVDISDPGVERTAVAVRQGGLSIEAGSHYVATISVRAATTREVRLRIASAAGDTYATRLFTVGPEWQVLTVDSTVFATDLAAYIEIDLGRFAATTWLDDASFAQVAATGG